MAKIDTIDVPKIIWPEAAAPSTPASGKVITYAKSDGLMYSKDDAGTETLMSGGGGTPTLTGASYKRTSGNYTTSSTTMVDVDGTNLALTISTGARRVLIGFVGTVSHSTTGQIYFDVAVDGTDQGQASGPVYGLVGQRITTANYILNTSFTYLTDALTAASHTFKLRWATTGATATLQGGAANCAYMQFWVTETLIP